MKGENVLRPGDVLITTGATIGKTSIIPDDFDCVIESIATGYLTVARAKSGIKPEFLSSILGSSTYRYRLAGHARGSTVQHLSIRSLRKLMIPVPSVPVLVCAILHEMWNNHRAGTPVSTREITRTAETLLKDQRQLLSALMADLRHGRDSGRNGY